jgi:hypothetical protein
MVVMLATGLLMASCAPDGGDCSPCTGANYYFELTLSDGTMMKVAAGGEDSIGTWSTVTCTDTQLQEIGYTCSCPMAGVCRIYDPTFDPASGQWSMSMLGPCTCAASVTEVSVPESGCRQGFSCSAGSGLDGYCISDSESFIECQ